MSIFLPIAGMSVNLVYLLGIGMLIGFLSGLLGVGGGFLMTPMLMLLGIPPTVAAASDSCQIVAASSSGLAAHLRIGNVDLRMGGFLLAGGLTGGVPRRTAHQGALRAGGSRRADCAQLHRGTRARRRADVRHQPAEHSGQASSKPDVTGRSVSLVFWQNYRFRWTSRGPTFGTPCSSRFCCVRL